MTEKNVEYKKVLEEDVLPYLTLGRKASEAVEHALTLIDEYEALRGKVDVEKIGIWLETYKFPIITKTDEYGDNDKVTKADFAKKLAEYLEEVEK